MHWYKIQNEHEENSPCPRNYHSAVSVSNIVYIFGGRDENEIELDDLYSVELKSYPIDPMEITEN